MLIIDIMLAVGGAAPTGLNGPGDIWASIVRDFSNLDQPGALTAFFQVLMIDLVLAGDNAIVVGALAAGLPPEQRKRVIMIGVVAALVLRIAFALVVSQLLQIVGLILAGGILLLWVAWKMWRELRHGTANQGSAEIKGDEHSGMRPAKSFAAAAWGVAIADISMSLDNVLAVAGAAREHPGILIVGLIIAVVLMGVAANLIARYIERYRWIAYVGLLVILWVALKMIWDGYHDVAPVLGWPTVSAIV
jgi:YjbE family integral membrane protein